MERGLFACIDTETSGLIAGYHNLLEVAVVPADKNFKPFLEPFNVFIKPENNNISPEAIKVNGVDLDELNKTGMTVSESRQAWYDWYNKNVIENGYDIILPIGHNYAQFDYSFILHWLNGKNLEISHDKSIEKFISRRCRDTMILAIAYNDIAEKLKLELPFPDVSQQTICKIFNIPQPNAHSAIADCYTTLKIWKTLINWNT